MNHVSGFRPVDDVPGELLHREPFTLDVEAERFGFKSTATPRTDRSVSMSPERMCVFKTWIREFQVPIFRRVSERMFSSDLVVKG